jgi:hypothetical protein
VDRIVVVSHTTRVAVVDVTAVVVEIIVTTTTNITG